MVARRVSGLKNCLGAPILLLIFMGVSFLTRFGVPQYFIFGLFSLYGVSFLLLNSGTTISFIKIKNFYLLQFFMLFYMCFFLSIPIKFPINEFGVWRLEGVMVFSSIILANLVVLHSSERSIYFSLKILEMVSSFMVFESVLFFILPDHWNIFRSDMEAGYRFISLLTSGYTQTGLFLILGYVVKLQLKSLSAARGAILFLLFLFALVQTEDRTSLLTFIGINTLYFFKHLKVKGCIPNGVSSIVLITSCVFMLLISYGVFSSLSDRSNILSTSSLIDRYSLVMRGIDVASAVMPWGGGPGSSVRLMMSDNILLKEHGESIFISEDELIKRYKHLKIKRANGQTMSTHNTYLDFIISFGVVGLMVSFVLFMTQLRAFYKVFSSKLRTYHISEIFYCCSICLFMAVSFTTTIWLWVLMFRIHVFFQNQQLIERVSVARQ